MPQKHHMPKPVSRRVLIEKLKVLGFDGPFIATKHQFMIRGNHKIFIPNPHGKDIGTPLVMQIIHQLGMSNKAWNEM